MVRNYYTKKNTRLGWTDGQLYLAINSVRSGNSCKSAALKFGVPRSTLQDKLKTYNDTSHIEKDAKKVMGFARVFNDEQEAALASYINYMESRLIGLTSTDLRNLAFEFAEKLRIKHNFNRVKRTAGKDWLKGFLARNGFSHRKAEHTSAARASGFNQESVSEFFSLLKAVLDQYDFTPDRIYNVDETGISIVPKTSPKIITRKGKKQVGGKTVAERGETVTAGICMSAAGTFMPPMLIFPRVRENKELLAGAPAGSWAVFHKTGYMHMDSFANWGVQFAKFSRASTDNPVLLLLDGHVSHVKNIQLIEFAKANGIVILCFPPHCTHKLQPLDVGFMGPLNSCFGKEVATLLQQQVSVNLKNLFSIFGRAFLKAAKMETAVNSFKKCGIWPFNPTVFSESDFIASKREGIAIDSPSISLNNSESETKIVELSQVIRDITETAQTVSTANADNCQPLTHRNNTTVDNEEGEVKILLADITQAAQPLFNLLNFYSSTKQMQTAPEIGGASPETQPKKVRAKGKAAVITDDQYKENLLAGKMIKIKKEKVESTQQKSYKRKIKSSLKASEVSQSHVSQPPKRRKIS